LVASLDLVVVRPLGDSGRGYLYGLLSQPEFQRYCRSRANGTTVLHLSRRAVPEYMVSKPDREALREYETRVSPLLDRMLLADQEAAALIGVRQAFVEATFGS
jgi:type I restriction enzyme, S subunit